MELIPLKLSEIAQAVQGTVSGADVLVTGNVETDSRLVGLGDLFIAKPGEFADGHDFVGQAVQKGAIAALVNRQVNVEVPQIVVEDSVVALGKLAQFVLERIRNQGRLKVIGITGSNGKTSTKNMLREVLSVFGNTVAPIESYNNEVGAPYSMLKCDFETDYLVAELGADGIGSIKYLAEMCKPDLGIVLKVGLAHVGEFGGIEQTFKIKSELPQSLGSGAKVLLNADDILVSRMAELTNAEVHWFGTDNAECCAKNISVNLSGTSFDFISDGTARKVHLKILGEHQVMNALASLSAARLLGLDLDRAVAALEAMKLAERWRMQVLDGPRGSVIINDAYNASPDSMRAALQTLATLGKLGHRTIAVLGEMAELGSESVTQHDELGRLVVRLNIDRLFVVGEGAKLIHLGAMQEGSWDNESKYFPSIDEALAEVRDLLGSGDIVLVKSSKSADLRFLGDALAEVSE